MLALGALLLGPGLCMIWYWQRVVMPPELTRLHAQELVPVIASFEAAELSLKSQLHPVNILSVATKEYLPVFESINTALHCAHCDQF